MRFVLLGNPDNRRVTLFQEALARQGEPPARVVSWLEVAREGAEAALASLPDEPALLRIESCGEDFEVERALLLRGEAGARALGAWTVPREEVLERADDRGRIFAPRQQHLGFVALLDELARALEARPWLRPLSAPRSIERLFDKRACAALFASKGVPIPRPFDSATDPDALRACMEAEETTRALVKLSCGSSASCLAIYDHAPGRGDWLFTSMEIDGDRLYNSLRPRRYRRPDAIDRLLRFLFAEGSHVEAYVPKARSEGSFFDTRMLVVEGEVPFTVMRKSPHPITNLHLGGTRGTPEELEARVPPEVRRAAEESCRLVFESFDCLHVGVDVMFTADLEDHRVIEANAFGDLLPNLERNGLSVYEWQIRAARRRAHDGR